MDDKIKSMIDEYIAKVEEVCCKLLEGINRQENLKLRTKWDFFEYRGKVRKTVSVSYTHLGLLEKGEKAKDVCRKVGYFDYRYFNKQFKKYVGMTPDTYKRTKIGLE